MGLGRPLASGRELTLESVAVAGTPQKFIRVSQLPAEEREARSDAKRKAAEVRPSAPSPAAHPAPRPARFRAYALPCALPCAPAHHPLQC